MSVNDEIDSWFEQYAAVNSPNRSPQSSPRVPPRGASYERRRRAINNNNSSSNKMSKLVSEATHLMSLPISGYLMYRCLALDFGSKTDIKIDTSAKKVAKDVLLIAATCATFLNALIAFGAIPKGGALAKRLDVVLGLLGLVVLGCAIAFLASDGLKAKDNSARKQELELGAVGLVLAAVMGASYYFDAGIHVGGRRRVRGRG